MVSMKVNEVEYIERMNELTFSKDFDREGTYYSLYTALHGIAGSTFVMSVRNKTELRKFF